MKKNLVILIGLWFCTLPLFAENKTLPSSGSWGFAVSAGYEGSLIGPVLHMGSSFLIKPAVSFNFASPDSSDELASTDEKGIKSYTGFALDLLYFSPLNDSFALYFGPRFFYSYNYNEVDYSAGGRGENTYQNIYFGLVFGSQFMLSKNFGFFADFGVKGELYLEETKTLDSSGTTTAHGKENDFRIRSTVANLGVVFYFN